MLDARRISGPGAGVAKYDLLTALSVAALHGPQNMQVSVLRLIALVTARYNWQRDELSIGQAEMARLWGVNLRTAKREVKRLITYEIVTCLRPGVRGRVAAYRLDREGIAAFSRPIWAEVGPDFAERMAATAPEASGAGQGAPKVVHLPVAPREFPKDQRWGRTLARLQEALPGAYANWFRHLDMIGSENGLVALRAPNAFVRDYVTTHLESQLIGALAGEFENVARVQVTVE